MSKLAKMLAVVALIGGAAVATAPTPAQARHGWHGHHGGWHHGWHRGGGWGWGPGFALGFALGAPAYYGYYGGPYSYGYGAPYAYGGRCGWRTLRIWHRGYWAYRRVWRCW